LTARSEPYNRKAIHASRLKKSANALRGCDLGKRCDREKPRLAAVTSLRGTVAKGKAKEDKRESEKEKDWARDKQRLLRQSNR